MADQETFTDESASESSELDRYCIGIDLGTTNCVLAFVRPAEGAAMAGQESGLADRAPSAGNSQSTEQAGSAKRSVEVFAVPQWVDLGMVESRSTLPSFLYSLTSAEAGQQLNPEVPDPDVPPFLRDAEGYCVGEWARVAGSAHPGRLISSAKSWFSHEGVDRTADLLPWHGEPDVPQRSPQAASAAYLSHLRRAWDEAHPDYPMADQDVVITLPASFDEVARELTVAAAAEAGLPRIQLIEEPQAAFYAWLDRHAADWMSQVKVGQTILVCDIGGGTTDLTLIRVREAAGPSTSEVGTGPFGNQVSSRVGDVEGRDAAGHKSELEAEIAPQVPTMHFHRVAVGKHLILGGDNLDLAVAKAAEARLDSSLPARQWQRLVAVARDAKETMLSAERPEATTLHVAGDGASLIGGSLAIELTREEIDAVLLDGFFPDVPLDADVIEEQSGFQELGLPYASDPAITKHLARFLQDHRRTGLDDEGIDSDRVDLVLFNGGVLRSAAVQDRILGCLQDWFQREDEGDWKPQFLHSPRLDLAVAQGAAYYALVRRGEGVRISANLARSYFMQISQSPPKAVCVIPADAQPGQGYRIDSLPMQLRVGVPVSFPLWVSSTRLADRPGDVVDIDESQMTALPPIQTALRDRKRRDQVSMEVVIETQLTEIGTIGLYCVAAESLKPEGVAGGKRWKLEFDIRATLETDRANHGGAGEASGIVDEEAVQACRDEIDAVFVGGKGKPSRLVKQLQATLESKKDQWPPVLLRQIWESLMRVEPGRRQSAAHEARWLNLLGYALRPGYGVAVDDWRTSQTWRLLQGKVAHNDPQTRSETLVLWRRISGGLTAGQQSQLASNLRKNVLAAGLRPESAELSEAWRLVGSLEQLSVPEKTQILDLAFEQLGRKKAAPLHPVIFWAIGRIATRVPTYGPINLAIGAPDASRIIRLVIALPMMQNVSGERMADAVRVASALALTQVARRCGDRFRDIGDDDRDRVIRQLRLLDAPEHWLSLVDQGGQFDNEEQAAIFGDTLPLGIELSR
ncbi:Hsp70 protein [Neorhodopirellula lusitana]|uniref:Hsp70 protein n=1 Tax=Neorhodopirellula lusitana TaxID=445327 RepID=A0ABY1PQ83_9BACT|nr:hsp70 family protein [Neorhodopirellula lusitana]SMP40719.1 Hsp70 protein [Neorhodopirellula lusitana]